MERISVGYGEGRNKAGFWSYMRDLVIGRTDTDIVTITPSIVASLCRCSFPLQHNTDAKETADKGREQV